MRGLMLSAIRPSHVAHNSYFSADTEVGVSVGRSRRWWICARLRRLHGQPIQARVHDMLAGARLLAEHACDDRRHDGHDQ